VRFISFPELKLGILNIDQTGEMVYTYGMKHFGGTVAETNRFQSLLMIAEDGKQLARRAGGE